MVWVQILPKLHAVCTLSIPKILFLKWCCLFCAAIDAIMKQSGNEISHEFSELESVTKGITTIIIVWALYFNIQLSRGVIFRAFQLYYMQDTRKVLKIFRYDLCRAFAVRQNVIVAAKKKKKKCNTITQNVITSTQNPKCNKVFDAKCNNLQRSMWKETMKMALT